MSDISPSNAAVQEIVLDSSIGLRLRPSDGVHFKKFGCDPNRLGVIRVVDNTDQDHVVTFDIDMSQVTPDMLRKTAPSLDKVSNASGMLRQSMFYDSLKKLSSITQKKPTDESNEERTDAVSEEINPFRVRKIGSSSFVKQSVGANKAESIEPKLPPSREAAVSAPDIAVVFEIDEIGSYDTYYHYAELSGEFLVLGYDRRYRGGSRFRPSLSNDNRSLFVHIANSNKAFCVYPFPGELRGPDNWDLTVLYVSEARSIPENNEASHG